MLEEGEIVFVGNGRFLCAFDDRPNFPATLLAHTAAGHDKTGVANASNSLLQLAGSGMPSLNTGPW